MEEEEEGALLLLTGLVARLPPLESNCSPSPFSPPSPTPPGVQLKP